MIKALIARTWNALPCIVLLCFSGTTLALEPWSENAWYWSVEGQPVLLLGGSDDDNLFQWPAEKLIPQLDRIVSAGGNVIRNTMSDRDEEVPFLDLLHPHAHERIAGQTGELIVVGRANLVRRRVGIVADTEHREHRHKRRQSENAVHNARNAGEIADVQLNQSVDP